MKKRLAAWAMAGMMWMSCTSPAWAELAWPAATSPNQQLMVAYVDQVNAGLQAMGASPLNCVFECYDTFASIGVAASDQAEVPEGVELILTMGDAGLHMLTLQVSRLDQFAILAAACIQAASPMSLSISDTLSAPQSMVKKAQQEPGNSFADEVNTLQGDQVRTYYAYEPDAYGDGVNYLTLTLIFPYGSSDIGGVYVTPAPTAKVEYNTEHEGNQFQDGFTHFEIVPTPTPDPEDGLVVDTKQVFSE